MTALYIVARYPTRATIRHLVDEQQQQPGVHHVAFHRVGHTPDAPWRSLSARYRLRFKGGSSGTSALALGLVRQGIGGNLAVNQLSVQPQPVKNNTASHPQIPRRAVGRPGVQIAARGNNRGMAEGGLHKMDRGAMLQVMAGVRVPQPVSRDGCRQARMLRRSLHDLSLLLKLTLPPSFRENGFRRLF